jgi:hypothetical protein
MFYIPLKKGHFVHKIWLVQLAEDLRGVKVYIFYKL